MALLRFSLYLNGERKFLEVHFYPTTLCQSEKNHLNRNRTHATCVSSFAGDRLSHYYSKTSLLPLFNFSAETSLVPKKGRKETFLFFFLKRGNGIFFLQRKRSNIKTCSVVAVVVTSLHFTRHSPPFVEIDGARARARA